MNVGLVLATFAIIIPAELPDKTFIASVVLSARHRPFPVWIGAAAGLVLQAFVAVVAGRFLALLPHRVVAAIVAFAFLAGATYLLVSSEATSVEHGEKLARRERARVEDVPVEQLPVEDLGEVPTTPATSARVSSRRIIVTSFLVVTAAEFGDLTQVIIANLTARYRAPLSVFVGAAAGFIVVSALGVVAGRTLTRLIPLALVRKISALALIGLGIWSALGAAGV